MTHRPDEIPALSHDWFTLGSSLLSGVVLASRESCSIQFDAAGTRWYLRIGEGRVTEWLLGSVDAPDVEIRWSKRDTMLILRRDLRGEDAMRATGVVADLPGGRYEGPPAPLNLMCRPELDALPRVPGATFVVQYHYRNGPFGDVAHVLRFTDGRLVEEGLGEADRSDVRVVVTYRAMAEVRAGEISILDALTDGSVDGELGTLAALAGILESPEFHTAELATGRHALALAVLGDLDSDAVYQSAIAELVSRTRWD